MSELAQRWALCTPNGQGAFSIRSGPQTLCVAQHPRRLDRGGCTRKHGLRLRFAGTSAANQGALRSNSRHLGSRVIQELAETYPQFAEILRTELATAV